MFSDCYQKNSAREIRKKSQVIVDVLTKITQDVRSNEELPHYYPDLGSLSNHVIDPILQIGEVLSVFLNSSKLLLPVKLHCR